MFRNLSFCESAQLQALLTSRSTNSEEFQKMAVVLLRRSAVSVGEELRPGAQRNHDRERRLYSCPSPWPSPPKSAQFVLTDVTIGFQRSISAWMNAPKLSAPGSGVLMPNLLRRSANSGSRYAAATVSRSLASAGAGARAWASRPYHTSVCTPGKPVSFMVTRSGSSGDRS